MPLIIEELAVALTLEANRFNQGMSQADRSIEGLKRQFAAAQGQITRAGQRLDAFERETNQVRAATDRATRSFQSQRDAVNSLGRRLLGLIGFYIGFRQVSRLIRDSTTAFFEQARASNELGVALQRAGIAGSTALAQLERGASDIQTEFNLADEAITRATARVSAFAPALRLPDLQRAQRAVAGLSHVMGGTDTAANALAKTLGGQTNLLGRYGITVDATATAQEKLNQVLAAPAVQTALVQLAANAQTVEGRVRAASVQWGEFKESLGGVIVDMVSAGEKANSLAGAIASLTAKIEANREEWVRTGRIIVGTVAVIASTITNIVQSAVSGIAALVNVATFQIQTLQRVARGAATGPVGLARALFGVEAQASATGLGGDLRHRFGQIKGDIKDVTMAWEAARQRVEQGAQAMGVAVASAGISDFAADLGSAATQAHRAATELSPLTSHMTAYALAAEKAREAQERLNLELEEMSGSVVVRATVAAEAQQERFERVRTEVERFSSHVEDAAVSIVSHTDSIADAFKRMVQSIIADLARLTLQRTIIGPLVDAIAGSLSGGGGGGVTEVAGLGTHGVPRSASVGRFTPAMATAGAPAMNVVMQNTFEIRSIDTREGAQFLRQHAPAIGQLAAREFQTNAGLQSLVRGRR